MKYSMTFEIKKKEKNEGRVKDQMVEVEEGILFCGLQGELR